MSQCEDKQRRRGEEKTKIKKKSECHNEEKREEK